MRNDKWRGIVKLIELQHLGANGEVLRKDYNILNLLHQDGEEYLLRAAFTGGQVSDVIPEFYYLGLDNRQEVDVADTIDDLIGEPLGSGYERQSVASSGDFAINLDQSHFLATSPIVAFRATTGSWGPVTNLFMTTADDDSGYLISTVVLTSPISLSVGQSVTMRIGLTLKDCP